VADLDGDGDKEIIAGYSDGVYIWHHDGTPYSIQPKIFSNPAYYFHSSPVICDLDGDGQKEILIVGSKIRTPISSTDISTTGIIYALKPNGTVLSGWPTQSFPISRQNLPQEISVGDLNNDGNLEVVTIGTDIIKVWNKSGTLILSTSLQGVSGWLNNPILADVDGDNDIEILAASQDDDKLYAIKSNGTSVVGFPLRVDVPFMRMSPCVIDVDNNGKNEIIAAAGNQIYMWETNGNLNHIEWGSERHDPQNTGEYFKRCSNTLIKSNTVWNSNREVCDNIIVESGTLTLNAACTLTMNESSMIIVRPGGNLVIDGGSILNANMKALAGSAVVLKNNGYVRLHQQGEFNICEEATFDYLQGDIDITP
jgi:hypothetical protein